MQNPIQNEITAKTRLLDDCGNVANPGWCRHNLYEYSRKDIKAPSWRIKEWDFYQISNSRYTVQITLADISLGGAATIGVFDRQTGKRADGISLSLLTFGRMKMSENANEPAVYVRRRPDLGLYVETTEKSRRLRVNGYTTKGKINCDIEMEIMPGSEYLTMALPFQKEGHFYLNQKQNCMPCRGALRIGDEFSILFDPKDTFCVLDWGRGVWPYHEKWYWGNGSTYIDGKLFGFEIGWGFGDMSAASENTVFYDGKAHKIGEISLKKPHRFGLGYMKPWEFVSSDGRFNMTMTPEYDNHSMLGIPFVFGMHCHQVHGKWNGTVILDDGTKLEIRDMYAFCEHADNRW